MKKNTMFLTWYILHIWSESYVIVYVGVYGRWYVQYPQLCIQIQQKSERNDYNYMLNVEDLKNTWSAASEACLMYV